jgi:hypothetical protein
VQEAPWGSEGHCGGKECWESVGTSPWPETAKGATSLQDICGIIVMCVFLLSCVVNCATYNLIVFKMLPVWFVVLMLLTQAHG